MRNFTSKVGSIFAGALTLALTAVFATPANAAVELGDENQVLEPGVEYVFPEHKPVSGIYTPPVSGKLITTGATNSLVPYLDAAHETLLEGTSISLGSFSYNVTAGETIYFYNHFPMQGNIPFVFYMEGVATLPLDMQRMQPDQDKGVDFTNYPDMIVTFNQDIQAASDKKAYLSFTNALSGLEEKVDASLELTTTSITVPLYSVLRPYIASGAIKPLDPFTVTVAGITSAVSGEAASFADADGNMQFRFLCGNIAAVRTSYYCPDPFLSFWPEGTPEGILTMEFDQELGVSELGFADLIYGNTESENDFYFERLPLTIEGNKVSVDFTGKIRTPLTMTPEVTSTYVYPTILVKIGNIVDKYGLPVASDGIGKVGTYEFVPAYELLNSVAVASDFEPASGTPLDQVNEVSVYITGLKGISFDGFALKVTGFDGSSDTVVIPMSAVTVSGATEDAAEYAFTIPARLKGAKTIEVTLNNLVNLDGVDHSQDLRAIYGTIYATPEPGTVDRLSEFVIEYLQPITADFENDAMPTLTVLGEGVDITLGQIYAEGSQLHINLNTDIVVAGNYELSIPAGFVIYSNSMQPAPAQAFTYTVEVETPGEIVWTVDPAEGKVASLPKFITVQFPDFDMVGYNYGAPKATLTIDGGSPIDLTDEPSEMPEDWNAWYIELPQAYNAAGTYRIEIPAEYFALGETGSVLSPAITLSYTIGNTSGVDMAVAQDGRYTVYNLTGAKVLDTDNADAIRTLVPGVYVVNGVKVLVK